MAIEGAKLQKSSSSSTLRQPQKAPNCPAQIISKAEKIKEKRYLNRNKRGDNVSETPSSPK